LQNISSPPVPRKRRAWPRHLAVFFATLFVASVLTEISLRLFFPVDYLAPIPGTNCELVHRKGEIEGIAYDLVPGAHGVYAGKAVEVNSLGMRGPEVALAKAPGTFRVAAIGDSLTFGYGVLGEEAWPAALGRALNENPGLLGAQTVEVLNLGVSGYNSQDEAVVLEKKALALDPDVVVVGYFLNDPQIVPLQPLHRLFRKPALWEHSHLLRWIDQWLMMRRKAQFGGDGYRYQHDKTAASWRSVLDAFDSMHRSSLSKGVPVILATLPAFAPFPDWATYRWTDLHEQVLDAARERGLDAFDLLPAFRSNGGNPKTLSVDSEHPNAAGHEIIARALAAEIRRVVASKPH
jgi:lysophospholipase L1-like esterase